MDISKKTSETWNKYFNNVKVNVKVKIKTNIVSLKIWWFTNLIMIFDRENLVPHYS